jgi:DNA excision repair protein ERCC-6
LDGLSSQCINAGQTFHNFDLVPVIKDKYCLQSQLWNQEMLPYQREGTRWLLSHHSKGEGGVLADEMGLGKTAQTIMMLAALHLSGKFDKPVLVITPTTIMRQWVREMRRWWSPLRVVILHSSGHLGREALTTSRVRSVLREMNERGHVLVTSYGTLRAFSKVILSNQWLITVLDEGHRIRNPEAAITKVCKELKADSRFILSGTPIQNNLIELWSLLDFVCAGRLGSLPVFKAEFVAPISAGGYVHATHFQVQLAYQCACTLKELIEPFLLRRIKADVAQQLPPKEEQILFCQLTTEQRQLYEDCLKSDDIQSILEGERNVLAGIDLLRKICNHTALVRKDKPSSFSVEEHCSKSGKLAVVKALLNVWKEEGHRALLFCQTRQMLDIVETFVKMLQIKYLRMDGTTSVRQRPILVDQFNTSDGVPLFLLTTKVGGLGVNLTGANRVIIYDPDWNPSTDLQARERVWRLGQHRPVSIYRLVMSGTIEEKIYHRQIFKQFLTNRILRDPKQARFFKATDLYDLFTLGDNKQAETAEMFSGLEQEIALKMGRRVHVEPDESVKKGHEELVPDNTHILDTLFHAVDGLHSAIRHDLIVERPSRERILVQHEVSKLARDAADALKQSHQLLHVDPNSLSERLFRTVRANDSSLSSTQLVAHFSKEVNATNSSTLFKALLKSIATFDHNAKKWQLKHEFAQL